MTARDATERRDPWATFVEAATGTSGGVFYFERHRPRATDPGWVVYGTEPSARRRVSRPSDWDDLREALTSPRPRDPSITVGCLGFEAAGLFEPLLARGRPAGSPFPLAEFETYDRPVRSPDWTGAREPAPGLPPLEVGRVRDMATPASFGRSVERLREAILDGEAFQVVLAHRRERPRRGSLLALVDRLRRQERYAYLFYARFGPRGEREVAGASPESVMECRRGWVEVNPIAGTRPHPPKTPRLPLTKDPKELAEHRMLVDLARNDLGRVCRVGSVKVAEREVTVRYARLDHLVSRVVGRLVPGLGALDALKATFPAGTVSGAPKIRATELLRREEGTWRGVYGGGVGVFDAAGNAAVALAIRAAFASGPKVYTEAGAGIVHLSEPRREWEETLTKLAGVEDALEGSAGRAAR